MAIYRATIATSPLPRCLLSKELVVYLTVLAALLPCVALTYDRAVYVSNDSDCNDTIECGNHLTPCCTLEWVVGMRMRDDTEVIMIADTFSLTEPISFKGYNNIALRGTSLSEIFSSGSGSWPSQITIHCETGAGLSFIGCRGIAIENIEFIGCGAAQNSTSRSFSDNEFSFMKVPVGIYFQYCMNVTLSQVNVTHSAGIGVTLIACGGRNLFEKCKFEKCKFLRNIPVVENGTGFGGGGLYIEFPYCSPADQTTCSTMPYSEYNSNAVYEIADCVFKENEARPTKESIRPSHHQFLPPDPLHHNTIGHGGGIGLHFCKASNIHVSVRDTLIEQNKAYYGAGIVSSFEEHSIDNTVLISGTSELRENSTCRFKRNRGVYLDTSSEDTLQGSGGGLRVLFWFSYRANHSGNTLNVSGCQFEDNDAFFGGAVVIQAAPEMSKVDPTNFVNFKDCVWTDNTGRIGSAMLATAYNESAKRGALLRPTFEGCVFKRDTGGFVADYLPIAFSKSVEFSNTRNTTTATGVLTIDHTTVEFLENCRVNFTYNRASYGGAIALQGHAFLRVHRNTTFLFKNNYANRDGGAIYQSSTETDIDRNGPCFIQYYDSSVPPSQWETSFTFDSNRENIKTRDPVCNSMVLSSLIPCMWEGYHLTEQQNRDALRNAICGEWSNILNFSSANCISEEFLLTSSSDDSSHCAKHIRTLPNQIISHTVSTVPGRLTNLNIKLIDDLGRDVSKHSVLNAWTAKRKYMNLSENSFFVTDNSAVMYGNYITQSAQLYVDTLPPRPMFSKISVKFYQCPPGFVSALYNKESQTCKCERGFGGNLKCNGANLAFLRRGYWIGKLDSDSDKYFVGPTPYTQNGYYSEIQLPGSCYNETEMNDLLCGALNREGTLCGRCKEGYSPTLHSNNFSKCIRCHPNYSYEWVLWIIFNILPITVFFVVVVIFNVSATFGAMNSFVFFAQVITASFSIDAGGYIPIENTLKTSVLVKICYAVYSIWRLDVIAPAICYYNPIPTPIVLLLLYINAIYPLILIALFLIIVKLHDHGVQPFYGVGKWVYGKIRRFRQPWTVERTVIHALATFLVLSFTKITAVSFMIIAPAKLTDHRGTSVHWVPYYYGDITYSASWPYILVALLFLMTMVIFPTLLLLALPARTQLGKLIFGKIFKILRINQDGGRLEIFLQTFQGSFKDGSGSDDEINCQKFAGLYLLLRFIIFMLAALLPAQNYLLGQQILCTVAIVMFAIFRPYRKNIHNYLDILAFSLLATINAITFYHSYLLLLRVKISPVLIAIQYILVYVPLIILILVISRTILRSCCGKYYGNSRLSQRFRKLTTTDADFVQFARAVSMREPEYRYEKCNKV